MNFDFSDEQKQFADEAGRFFEAELGYQGLRRFLASGSNYDTDLYRRMGELGWLGTTFPEEYGGLGLAGYELCLISEVAGRWVAPVPLSSSICAAGEALSRYGRHDQKSEWLESLSTGESIATMAISEGLGGYASGTIQTRIGNGRLSGVKWPVPDGLAADMAIVLAITENSHPVMVLVDLDQPGVKRDAVVAMDTLRKHATIEFDNAEAQILGDVAAAQAHFEDFLDNAAIYTAFEQVGGAQAAFDLAQSYVQERFAFGRQIGSYQAVKHKLADLFVSIELARSNAYYAAWTLAENSSKKRLAAATARISASAAFSQAAREGLHLHGGVGYTMEYDCHWYYRRERLLAVSLGSENLWSDRLVAQLEPELTE